ncbi:hypothetical protein C2845_PMPSC004506 [Panicum miliaceum]|uniref:Dehydrogenase/reductase SDR family member 12 n=1 Tax=Panicum miliaceum TaxID=4540 RepID=A0A3L6PBQ9_PANMI|nr:hypothetical protein C2845_PMPSC004506 [Panicum miliaceum]
MGLRDQLSVERASCMRIGVTNTPSLDWEQGSAVHDAETGREDRPPRRVLDPTASPLREGSGTKKEAVECCEEQAPGPGTKQSFLARKKRGREERERGKAKMFIQKFLAIPAVQPLPESSRLFLKWNLAQEGEHGKKFREKDMQIRLDGKNCLVTGANSGIGFATAEGLASHGATVYMLCRSKERGEAALNQIRSKTGNENVHLEICDLSSINEVKSFATKFTSMDEPLHVLVDNSGLLEHKRETTAEGSSFFFSFCNKLELNFAVNVAATYTLTELVMPLLEKAAPDARVITVASGGMYTEPLNKDLQFSEGNFDGTLQYARNKRIQVALTEWWAEKYNKGVGFYSMHPGWAYTPGVAKILPGFSEKLSGNLRSNDEGADTVVWLALQPKEKLSPGAFYFDRAEAPKHLKFAGTMSSHSQINSIVDSIRSICGLPALG